MMEILLWSLIVILCVYLFFNQIHIHRRIMFTNDRITALSEVYVEQQKEIKQLNAILLEIKSEIEDFKNRASDIEENMYKH